MSIKIKTNQIISANKSLTAASALVNGVYFSQTYLGDGGLLVGIPSPSVGTYYYVPNEYITDQTEMVITQDTVLPAATYPKLLGKLPTNQSGDYIASPRTVQNGYKTVLKIS